MTWKNHRLTTPSNTEYSVPHLKRLLREVENILERTVSLEEWDALASYMLRS